MNETCVNCGEPIIQSYPNVIDGSIWYHDSFHRETGIRSRSRLCNYTPLTRDILSAQWKKDVNSVPTAFPTPVNVPLHLADLDDIDERLSSAT